MALAATECRFAVGAILIFAALAKAMDRPSFERAVAKLGLLPSRVGGLVANWLPRLELAAGGFLISGLGVRYTGLAVAAALVAFNGAIAINLAQGAKFDCGCRAVGAPTTIGWALLSRNVLLMAMAVLAAFRAPPVLAVGTLLGDRATGVVSSDDAFALLLSSLVVVLALTLLNDAFSLSRSVAAATRRQV